MHPLVEDSPDRGKPQFPPECVQRAREQRVNDDAVDGAQIERPQGARQRSEEVREGENRRGAHAADHSGLQVDGGEWNTELLLRDQARKFLSERAAPARVRRILETDAPYDVELWKGMVELAWPGTAIPEAYGGAGYGYLELCVIAEELGRSLAPTPRRRIRTALSG